MESRFYELDPAAETVVICHHGLRSAFVMQALQRAGFSNVSNLEGGLDAYAEVYDSVPKYSTSIASTAHRVYDLTRLIFYVTRP